MKTVDRLTAECELMNLHPYLDADGNLRGCPGQCLGNDPTTAITNHAGDHVRIICTCECHNAHAAEDQQSVKAKCIPTNVTCQCPSEPCVCQGGLQCACACSIGVDPNICACCKPNPHAIPKLRSLTHDETCAGCYEVAPEVFIHPPRSPKGKR